MTTKTGGYPLRLVVAEVEKVSAMATAEIFAERRTRADMEAFDRIMSREGGEPPQSNDTL